MMRQTCYSQLQCAHAEEPGPEDIMMGKIVEAVQCSVRSLRGFVTLPCRRTWGVVVASNADRDDIHPTEPGQSFGDERPVLISGCGGIKKVTRLDEEAGAMFNCVFNSGIEARPETPAS
jgi:hypothetical protein